MVFSRLDQKEKAYGTLVIFVAIAFVFYQISDSFSMWLSTMNPWIAMLITIILNPAYVILIYWLYQQYDLRGILAGFLISLAIDIISLTHSITSSGILPTDGTALPLYGYADTTIFKLIAPYINSQFTLIILYIVIPSILMYLALRIIRRNVSFNRIFKESI